MRSVATLKDQFEIVLGSQYKVSGSSKEITAYNVMDEKKTKNNLIYKKLKSNNFN